jgi:F-type H+-transporting ATPase subunit delta
MDNLATTVARNYAEALLALAQKAGAAEAWGDLLQRLVSAIEGDRTLVRFLESPRIPVERKQGVLRRALGDQVPAPFLRWLDAIVRNRRQEVLPSIATQYDVLLDGLANRVHARITLPSEPDQGTVDAITARLSTTLGKTVVPHVLTDPAILGGVIVRVGDTVMDGSVRTRLRGLRRRMLSAGA